MKRLTVFKKIESTDFVAASYAGARIICMPSLADDPLDPLTVLGVSAVRAGIVRLAAQSDSAVSARELMDELGVSRATLSNHTQVLVEAGILRQATDPAQIGAASGSNRLVWSVELDRIDQVVKALGKYLTNE